MKSIISILLGFFSMTCLGQQISIPRVDEMPDFPQPYVMRDWKTVAMDYDALVFDLQAAGDFLPLASVFGNTTNYPEHPALAIQSYVGTNSPPGKEAINVLPAVIGASLVGIDKSDQDGMNWPLYCEEYFNRRPAENVYLNGPVTSSGNDWWYETMPNIFFYQLNWLYPNTGDFNTQVTTLADRWLEAVGAMGGSSTPWEVPYMNYRAFKLSTMTPNASGVKQPEAAGAIAWILYQAYVITGEQKYRAGAEQCLEFLDDWGSNPSYEIQLPYGVYAAARMNAELGTQYDMEKLVNWCFDRGDLRGWGVITGEWNGIDMDGLIGEVNASQPDYVFHMNSLEHVGALVPMVRYDDRYATAIAKWVLNAANASRFYYSEFLADDMQDNESWTTQYDSQSAIAYESLRETPQGPYGTGDAMGGGWAETNLGLYGSSHVGIFGAIIQKTNVEGILQLDLLATDYYHPDAFPTHLFFNPYDENKMVEYNGGEESYDIYDAITNQKVFENVSGTIMLEITAKSSLMAVLLPAGSEVTYQLNRALSDGVVIDYNAGQTVANYPPRIKALAPVDSVAVAGSTFMVFCTAEDRESAELEYGWSVDGQDHAGGATLEWDVPETPGNVIIACRVKDEGGLEAVDSITVKVVEKINYPPIIEAIEAEDRILYFEGTTSVICQATDQNGDELTYQWQVSEGTIQGEGESISYQAPAYQADVYLVCEVRDVENATDRDSLLILVRDPETGQSGEMVAHYVFTGNANDITGNGHDGMGSNVLYVEDMLGMDEEAIRYHVSGSKVVIPNADQLNFQDGLTVSYWISVEDFFDRESYPVSHGNWTTRWKTSLTEERIRFTINGTEGTLDVDSDRKLELNTWTHVLCLYNGVECMVFLDGELNGFKPYEGKIRQTSYDLVLGQSLPDQSGFNFKGKMDNLRIYNYGISYEEVKDIYLSEILDVRDMLPGNDALQVYPNPVRDQVWIRLVTEPLRSFMVSLSDLEGNILLRSDLRAGGDGILYESFPLTDMPQDVYILTLTDGTHRWYKKIVKVNGY